MSSKIPSSPSDPRQIGPYRLDERLGRGGMGEVWRGYDDRLDRPVALKRIRPGLGDRETALKRFRREARAAARLRHPAIVQVHDWVEDESGAWLVMELVEGRSLRDLLHGGPFDPPRVVALARDLLEGLAVAHDAGFVHRDLKAENVMLTSGSTAGRGRGEQAKILDFGLAKSARPGTDETQLSEDGKIIGTLSAMAPEQVLGHDVDARTDLFSLGSLLYEALAGRPAFVGASAGETLNRICTARQMPLRSLRPEISVSLSTFVDQLLEKDPRRRPATAEEALDLLDRVSTDSLDGGLRTAIADGMPTEGIDSPSTPFVSDGDALSSRPLEPKKRPWLVIAAAAIFLVGLGAAYWTLGPGAVVDPIYVVVPETVVEAPEDRDLHLATSAIQTAMLRGLTGFRDVVALEASPRDAALEDPRALAQAMAADELLHSHLDCDSRECRLELRRGGADGRVIGTQAFAIEVDELLDIDRAVTVHLQRLYSGLRLARGVADLEVRPADYETFLRLRDRFDERDAGFDSDELLSSLRRLVESSPRFVDAHLLESMVALQRFQEEREPRYLERARRAAEEAERIVPEDSRVATWISRLALRTGDLATADRTLAQLSRLEPGNAKVMMLRAMVFEETGEIDRAIRLARNAVERLPSTAHHYELADLLYRQGRIDEAREAMEKGLGRQPENFDGLSRLAQLELTSGSAERAAELYESLIARSPEATELTNLGTAYLLLRDYEAAARQFEKVVELSPSSPFALLNLADVESLRGREDVSATLYREVVEAISADPRPERLASLRAQALAHLGQREKAVAAIQQALSQRPDHPWVAYEAALVYVLIGDEASALWNARRAVEGGVEPRWFSIPWFDPIRPSVDRL